MAKTAIRNAQAGTPIGGSAGQVLTKNSATNYDYGWAAAAGGGITSINGDTTAAQVLAAGANITITPGPAGTNTIAATAGGGMSVGGTVTSGTIGSVLFVGAGPVLAQDNANFFWDNTNNRLGLGTISPAQQLQITGNFRLPTSTSTTGIIFSGANRYIHNFGTNNFFAGVTAGNLTMTGNSNVGIGAGASDALTSGSANVAVGNDALGAATTGSSNVAVGEDAMLLTTTGGQNTAIGNVALRDNVVGTENTAIGQAALLICTGSRNTAIGEDAGDALTTGDHNIIIGTDIDVISPTANDQLTIGNIIFGTGVDGGGTSISTGNIGIGANDPAERLDVNGNITTRAQGSVQFQDAAGGQFIGLRAPSVVASSTTFDLPAADGTSGQVLVTDGAGALSFTDSSAALKVGVGAITDIQWFNTQIPFLSFSDGGLWIIGSSLLSPSGAILGTSDNINTDSTNYGFMLLDGQTRYQFDSIKQSIFTFTAFTGNTSGINDQGFFGFNTFGSGSNISPGSIAVVVGFLRDTTGQWYAKTADNTATTETAISISDFTNHIFRCEYDPANATPQARFYVDGVLLATVTTNIPSAETEVVGFYMGSSGGESAVDSVSCPSFAVEI